MAKNGKNKDNKSNDSSKPKKSRKEKLAEKIGEKGIEEAQQLVSSYNVDVLSYACKIAVPPKKLKKKQQETYEAILKHAGQKAADKYKAECLGEEYVEESSEE